MTPTAALARLARWAVRDYKLNWIYAAPDDAMCSPLPPDLNLRRWTPDDLRIAERSADAGVRKLSGYADADAQGLTLADAADGSPLAVAHFVDEARYDHADIWPLRPDQLALVNILTLPAARGRGHAARLIAAATPRALADQGRAGAICFIWWNHRASIRAFRRAGWRSIGFSVEIVTRANRTRRLRARWRSQSASC